MKDSECNSFGSEFQFGGSEVQLEVFAWRFGLEWFKSSVEVFGEIGSTALVE